MLTHIVFRLTRRGYSSDVRNVVLIQSCIRRRLARKELKALKAEARSVSKFKEISYRLENKVVELTQNLQKRTEEKKELQNKVQALEVQLQMAVSRHEESDARAKQIMIDFQTTQEELSRSQQLLRAKEDVERKLEEAIIKAAEKEAAVHKLTEELAQQAAQLETQQKLIDSQPARNAEDSSVIQTLKTEVSSLREQLNRATALNALTRGVRAEPTSPTFAPVLRLADAPSTNGSQLGGVARGHQRRHSSAGVYAISPTDHRTSSDELMFNAKRSQAANPRAVSVAYNGEDGLPQFRVLARSSLYDDPAEEKIRLMQDIKRLDEDVLDGLIRGLKIPAPSLTSPAAVKEILFPANLISLITNEMWKYGLIPESERFLANVMQTIQSHVMVSSLSGSFHGSCSSRHHSRSLPKKPSFPASSGFRTFTRCYPSSASRKAICCRVSVRARRTPFVRSSGQTTSALCLSSSMTSTVLSTTSTTRGCSRRRSGCRRWSYLLSSKVSHCPGSRRRTVEEGCSTACSTRTRNRRSAWTTS